LDIGPESIEAIKKVINTSRTLLWNGPMGAFEVPPFDCATNAVAQHAAAQTDKGDLYSVGGGGDTVAALENAGAKDQFSYISTAGGAFLEFIEGKTLPGVEALKQA
jgi:phosphoglycerate kinase